MVDALLEYLDIGGDETRVRRAHEALLAPAKRRAVEFCAKVEAALMTARTAIAKGVDESVAWQRFPRMKRNGSGRFACNWNGRPKLACVVPSPE
jgi:hypothetical protein